MERAALRRRLTWQTGTVVRLVSETARTRTIGLAIPGWPGHSAGQHVDIRLTAEDGYQAQRSYSVASAPDEEYVEITVDRLPDGEVSPYLVDELGDGEPLELRGPIGGYFIWEESLGGPLQLIAGGSGIVPFRSVLRYHRSLHSAVPVRLLYSVREIGDFIYHDELMRVATSDEVDVSITLTREQPDGWRGYGRRVDREMLAEAGWGAEERPLVYICGPTAFVETAAQLLVEAGHAPESVRTERFGGIGENS